MQTRDEKHEVTCAYCREQFRVALSRALVASFVRCPHCLSVFTLQPVATETKRAA